MIRPTIYVFANKGLNMSAGKLAAQVGHAVACVDINEAWLKPHRTILVMEARDEGHLDNIMRYLADRGVHSHPVIDEGVNEIDPHVKTAVATQVVDKEEPEIQQIFSTFRTYRDKVRVTLEIDR